MQEEQNPNVVSLIDENGEEVLFEHLDTIEKNGKTYVVCVPYEEDLQDVEEVIIFKLEASDEGEDCLVQIEDDDELDEIYEEFKERNADEFDFDVME